MKWDDVRKNILKGVYYITDDEFREAENDPILDDYPEWKQDSIKIAKDIITTTDYIKLPDDYEINDYQIMEDFCLSLEDEELSNKMYDSIQGNGAFRRFKDNIYKCDIAEKWYDYQNKRFREIAINWCERNGLEILENI